MLMTTTEIENFLYTAYSKAEYELMFQKTCQSRELFLTIWEMVRDRPPEKGWRLLWIMDHATEKDHRFILPILDELYQLVLRTKNESFIRHAMKLILRCPIDEEYAGALLERSIEWMNNARAKVSTQGLGLEFFYQVCLIYPELEGELLAHMDAMIERKPGAGMSVRIRQIREQLNKKARP
ncbi:hypothetical protein [Roseimarinus sediminis]|uniref:hypothetical protein n=1 Tax=Roseimarinus sediminis TaxID=1610899 RepID=UPI003D227397